jgi:outer membrane murein-binding lipoprotein Lpp
MPVMKSLACVLFAAALLAGCQNESKLDSGGLEARVKKLEETNKKYAEALDFLQKVYDQQKGQAEAQRKQQEENDPDPNAVFAVDITQNIKGGLVEGPATGAPVTIVEAWDFA